MKQKEIIRKSKFMRNKKSFFFLLILCLGIGFAFLTSNLTITGNTSVSGNKWSVYFDNVVVKTGSVDTDEPELSSNDTSLDFTVSLDLPGDYYEFTVDAINDGTIDAVVKSLSMTTLNENVSKYVRYTATYLDGTPLAEGDGLAAGETSTFKILVEYRTDINPSDLDESDVDLDLSFDINYGQSDTILPKKFVTLVKNDVLSSTGLDYTAISSASNGRGLYVLSGTETDENPIYYYRGAVTNNNAKFAGFCWKIVRTTETGGTKLIYNGLPDGNGQCTNTTGAATQLNSTSVFNMNYGSPAYTGYMYGTVYNVNQVRVETNNYQYGSSFTFEDEDENISGDGTYTLTNTTTDTSTINTHHYTCFNSAGPCSELYYVYYIDSYNSIMYYITLKDGKSIDDALSEMQTNTTNSNIKTAVDNWFANTFKTYFTNLNKDYSNYLEDTIWCNDRSMNTIEIQNNWNEDYVNNGWKPSGGSISDYLRYSAFGRRSTGTPSLACSNKNDSFTVTETATGNGALDYPVGLLTADEIMLAGGTNIANSDFYLYTNQEWWTLSPESFSNNGAYEFIVYSDGGLFTGGLSNGLGVRPSISLKPGLKVASGGDGTSATPYEFVVE